MRIPEEVIDHVDLITAVFSILGAVSCVYLQQMIVRETAPGVIIQRITLSILAIALLANGLYVFPEWALINGHRPTGIAVEAATAINMIVMAARGYVRWTPKSPPPLP